MNRATHWALGLGGFALFVLAPSPGAGLMGFCFVCLALGLAFDK